MSEDAQARPMASSPLSDAVTLARRFLAAIEAGDSAGVRAIYAPDARIWHNTDGLDHPGQDVEANLSTLAWMRRHLSDIRYEIVRLEETASGYAQTHVLRARTSLGETFALPAAIFCTVKDGRITRLDEYFREADLAPLLRAAQAQ
jgi:ketosteroid isomerase-like protein